MGTASTGINLLICIRCEYADMYDYVHVLYIHLLYSSTTPAYIQVTKANGRPQVNYDQ